jgi:arylformamidase
MKHIVPVILLFTVLNNAACAGPLREWLAERKAEKQDAAQSLNDESSSGAITLPEGARLLKDVAYGDAAEQRMDVYLPAHAENAPVIFMVHGGGWRRGDKASNTVVENKVARWVARGFIFISANYRLLPKADPLVQAEDVARALAAAQTSAAAWGGNPAKFVLMGHSAGAHLAALLAASPDRVRALGVRPWLGTVVLDSAAMNVVQTMESRHYRLYDNAFGKDAAFWKSASPFQRLSAGAAPMLLVCSTKRPDHPCEQARAFAAKAAGLGVRTALSEQALSHKEINQQLGLPGAYTGAVEGFMGTLDASVYSMLAEPGH